MVLCESHISVPAKRYKVNVNCIKTRRLTTMEWLVLSMTKKFENHPYMKDNYFKYAFEEVFQFQNSELLVKPCLNSLRNLQVIQINVGRHFDYSSLKFSDIILTELGDMMLKDGLLPGEPRQIPLDIYYNPLTGMVSNYDNSLINVKDFVEYGDYSDYPSAFPEKYIRNELQSGVIARGRFVASEMIIDDIEELASSDWKSISNVIVSVDESGEISTTPNFIESNMKKSISKLFELKEFTAKFKEQITDINFLNTKNIIGAGKRIKEYVLEICRNAKIIFIDVNVYNAYKKNTTAFKGKIVFTYGDVKKFEVVVDKWITIFLPVEAPLSGCIVSNEKNESCSLGLAKYKYDGEFVEVPICIEDARLYGKNTIVIEWLEKNIFDLLVLNISCVALYSLHFLSDSRDKVKEYLLQKWDNISFNELKRDCISIDKLVKQLGLKIWSLDFLANLFIEKNNSTDTHEIIQNLKSLQEISFVISDKSIWEKLVKNALERIVKPSNYQEYMMILDACNITNHDEALIYDSLFKEIYNVNVITSVIKSFIEKKFEAVTELFEQDVVLNRFNCCIRQIELHVSGLKIFENIDNDKLKKSVKCCPDIAALHYYVQEMIKINEKFLDYGLNMYDVIRTVDETKADAFNKNIKLLDVCATELVDGTYLEDEDSASETIVNKKVYIIDTCALIHNVDLLLYFDDSEYIRIPTQVIDELGKIKDKRSPKYDVNVSDIARILARDIERTYLRLYNKNNKVRFLIENSDISLLPKDLDASVPDNQILSVALKYKDCETTIISDDGVFRLASISQNISAISGDEFIESHKELYRSLESRIRLYNGFSHLDIDDKNLKMISYVDDLKKKISKKPGEISQKVDEIKEIQYLPIDDLPMTEIKKYANYINDAVITYLANNKIKKIGDLRRLTEKKASGFPAKSKQLVYKNAVLKAIKEMDIIVEKMS